MRCKIMSVVLVFAFSSWAAIPTADTVTNFAGMKFKRIPAGTFQMGFEDDSLKAPVLLADLYLGLYDEHPRHSVTLTHPFYMGVYEVKISEFKQFKPRWADRLASIWDQRGDLSPIHTVSWFEADSFCRWLTANDPNGYTYRLPTEAEWEYCCRAGTTTLFYTGDSISTTDANICPGWGCRIEHKVVGSYPPNPFGLYDMTGNAMEWCLDWYGPYHAGPDTNPAGYDDGDYKVNRDGRIYLFGTRSACRGGAVPEYDITRLGFRVVISDTGFLRFKAHPDTLSAYQRDVVQSRPAPGTVVSGETYLDADSREFRRVRMTRLYYPRQCDTIVYVSSLPIADVSATDRKSAGLFVQALSARFGVLYRLSNRYELLNAGITAAKGRYYITIIPELQYATGQPHPDVAYFLQRDLPLVALRHHSPVYCNWNQATGLVESGNGDLLMTVCTDVGENTFTTNQAVWRLRLGSSVWDSIDLFEAVPGFENSSYMTYDYRRGRLVANSVIAPIDVNCRPYYRTSMDNGATWSRPVAVRIPNGLCGAWDADGMLEMGRDTMVRVNAGNGELFISHDGGYDDWTKVATSMQGIEHEFCLLDNGALLSFNRDDRKDPYNVQMKWTLADISVTGVTTTMERSPFSYCCPPGSHNGDVGLVKLFSGRLLRRNLAAYSGASGRIVGESVDQGRTWFCRLHLEGGNGDIIQTRDGLIHFGTEMNRTQGAKREYVLSEQWLREQACKDVSEWGVNEPGMVSDCADTEPAYFDSIPPTLLQRSVRDEALLLECFPNPFNPSTLIHYALPGGSVGTLSVLNVKGERVFITALKSASGQVLWEAKGFPSGLYLARLSGREGLKKTLKILLVK